MSNIAHNNLLLHVNAGDTGETLITLERKGIKCGSDCGPKPLLCCCICNHWQAASLQRSIKRCNITTLSVW